jgi:hypothetical protein
MARNVLGTELQPCSLDPVTGYFRNGLCDTCASDQGMHTACAVMTEDFLTFSRLRGNNLSEPMPGQGFPGLKPGDRWCVCLGRWVEALHAGVAPKLVLESCHASVLEFLDLELLRAHARTE